MEADNRALRFNQGKRQWHLLPLDALNPVIDVLMYGAKKYAPRNWERGDHYSTHFDCLMRHLEQFFYRGEDACPESKCHHLAHAACNILFLLTYHVRGIGIDDRPKAKPLGNHGSDSQILSGTPGAGEAVHRPELRTLETLELVQQGRQENHRPFLALQDLRPEYSARIPQEEPRGVHTESEGVSDSIQTPTEAPYSGAEVTQEALCNREGCCARPYDTYGKAPRASCAGAVPSYSHEGGPRGEPERLQSHADSPKDLSRPLQQLEGERLRYASISRVLPYPGPDEQAGRLCVRDLPRESKTWGLEEMAKGVICAVVAALLLFTLLGCGGSSGSGSGGSGPGAEPTPEANDCAIGEL